MILKSLLRYHTHGLNYRIGCHFKIFMKSSLYLFSNDLGLIMPVLWQIPIKNTEMSMTANDNLKYYRSPNVMKKCSLSKTIPRPNWLLSAIHQDFEFFSKQNSNKLSSRQFSTVNDTPKEFTEVEFHDKADETLDSLTEKFEDIGESGVCDDQFDVVLGQGVLTIKLGGEHGTYVINKQAPNKQIWLSSPKSGPKRYDYINGKWIYKHDNSSLHGLLTEELSEIYNKQIDFTQCSYGGNNS